MNYENLKVPDLDLVRIRSIEEYRKYVPRIRSRTMIESRIGKENADKDRWFQIGFCQLCGRDTKFSMCWENSKNDLPNYREHLTCEYCKLTNRQRFMFNLLKKQQTGDAKSVFMYEAATYAFAYTKRSFNFNLIGSEFRGYDKKPGEVIDGIRHEDAMSLSFPEDSFDIMVSNDVFEHVPDIRRTLSEAYRVLRGGGILLISVPFTGETTTVRRAWIENNHLRHVLPPVHHSNSLSDDQLVFYDYGWDFLDFLKDASFMDAYMLAYYSVPYGYMGNGFQMIFAAHK